MHPKLRGTVDYAPTNEGILFRVGDHFLPIKGEGVWSWFQHIRPLLDGRSPIKEVWAGWGPEQQARLKQFVNGLQNANMLYDASLDDATLVPQTIQDHYRELISRIEARNSQPIRALSQARNTRALTIGRVSLALPVIDAGLESGLNQQMLWAPDWTTEADDALKRSLQRHGAATHQLKVDLIEGADCSRLGKLVEDADCVLLAGVIGIDDAWIAATIEATLRSTRLLCTLLVAGDRIIVSEMGQDSAKGCPFCLMDYCNGLSETAPHISVSCQEAGVAIGSRLLLQRLLDARSGSMTTEEQFMFHELDQRTFEIRQHPFPLDAGCVRCRNARRAIAGEPWPFADHSVRDLQVREFLDRAEKCFVDSKTGLIERLDEGDLLQFPHHQSAALRRAVQKGSRRAAWTTESGEDLYVARMGVIRRVLEEYLAKQLVSASPTSMLSVYTAGRNYAGRVSPADLPPGIVVSAINNEDMVPQAFFRALAVYAHRLDGWSDLEFAKPSIGTEAELTLAYLADIGVLNNIGVQRHWRLGTGGCEILRFIYRNECVSVAAGVQGTDLWTVGFNDIWLHVTACEAFPNEAISSPSVRFRCAATPTEVLSIGMDKMTSTLDLHLGLIPLSWDRAMAAAPLTFTFAFVSNSRIGS
jgi:hypothetical protein